MKRKRIKDESGFTLTEVLVTIMLMTMVVFALYSMFDMSLRVFRIGNSTVEANENARVALDRMEREIRSAWPSDDCADPTPIGSLIGGTSTLNSITFRNCVSDSSPVEITYSVVNGSLMRTQQSPTEPLATEPLATLGDTGSLNLGYCKASDSSPCPSSPSAETVLVEITFVARDGEQEQTLITNAGLRNAN